MDSATVKAKLIAVLVHIQATSELECPPLTGTTTPVEQIPKFNSPIWPVATSLLSTEIGVHIPDNVNIFFNENSRPHTIDQTVDFVCRLMERHSKQEAAVA